MSVFNNLLMAKKYLHAQAITVVFTYAITVVFTQALTVVFTQAITVVFTYAITVVFTQAITVVFTQAITVVFTQAITVVFTQAITVVFTQAITVVFTQANEDIVWTNCGICLQTNRNICSDYWDYLFLMRILAQACECIFMLVGVFLYANKFLLRLMQYLLFYKHLSERIKYQLLLILTAIKLLMNKLIIFFKY